MANGDFVHKIVGAFYETVQFGRSMISTCGDFSKWGYQFLIAVSVDVFG